MSPPLERLLQALVLEPAGSDRFVGSAPVDGWPRLYGGLVVAQTLVAGAMTIPSGLPLAVRATFLRAGRPGAALHFDVERLRDGRAFRWRRVVVCQAGDLVADVGISFGEDGTGVDHEMSMPQVEGPDAAARFVDPDRPWTLPVELRPVAIPSGSEGPGRQCVWWRADGGVPPDPIAHRALALYACDATLLATATLRHALDDPTIASLDYLAWFHRPFSVDTWCLFDQESPIAAGGRGFATGRVFTRDGRCVASFAQEGVVIGREGRA